MINITKRQEQVLLFIRDYINENKIPPTRKEIAKHFAFKSDNAAQEHIKALEKKGFLKTRKIKRGLFLSEFSEFLYLPCRVKSFVDFVIETGQLSGEDIKFIQTTYQEFLIEEKQNEK